MANSPIQSKGVGKDSKRHDLDGTPGLDSDLQQGEVSLLEGGQKAVQNTQGQPVQGQPLPQQAPSPAVQAPDPIQFAAGKVGGNLTVPDRELSQINSAQWLPLLEKLARSNSASPVLRKAYVDMLSRLQAEPFSGSTGLVDKRALDAAVANGF